MASQPPSPTNPAEGPVDVPIPSPGDPTPPTPIDPGTTDPTPDPMTEGP